MAAPGPWTFDHLGRYPLPMVDFIIRTLAGSLLGMLAGMGVGGGSLLLLWLTQIANFSTEQARITILLFYLPAAVVSSIFFRKEKAIRFRPIFPGILGGCTAAFFTSFIGRNIDLTILKKALGVLLIAIGIRELLYRPRNAR